MTQPIDDVSAIDDLGGGGGGSPTDATYLTTSTNATLTDERVLTAGDGISLTDAGAGSTLTADIDISPLTSIPSIDAAADLLVIEDVTDGSIYKVTPDGLGLGGGSGDVTGPASSTDNAIALFNGTTGKIIKGPPTSVAISSDQSGRLTIGSTRFIAPGGSTSSYNLYLDSETNTGISFLNSEVIDVGCGAVRQFRFASNGCLVGTPTGGAQGSGTINAVGVYDDGSLLTDYVFDASEDGTIDTLTYDASVPNRYHKIIEVHGRPEEIDPDTGEVISPAVEEVARIEEEERFHQPARDFDLTELDPSAFAGKCKLERKLPAFKRMETRVKAKSPTAKPSLGEINQALVETCEVQAVHIKALLDRVEALEARVGV